MDNRCSRPAAFHVFVLVLSELVVTLPLFGAALSTTLLTAPSSSVLGQQVTMTATVSPLNATGNVTFYDGTTLLGMRKLTGGTATLTTALLPAGAGSLKAYYAGDTTYSPSTSAVLAQTVKALLPNGISPPVPYGAGSYPQALVVGDFNGDGKTDLAVGDTQGNSVSVLLGNGDGSFQKAVTYALGSQPTSIAEGDFNGDSKVDLAVTYSGNSSVYVMFGNGDGTFQAAVRSATTGSSLSFVAVADFNGDGFADLVVANNNFSGGLVTVLLGNGNGTFQSAVNLAAGLAPSFVVVGDFNGDGKADLAATNFNGKNISVFLGNGDGTFRPSVFYDVGTYPNSMAVGDFNGDGKADLAVANQFDENVSVLLGNGDGTFKAKVNYAAGGYPAHLAVGDINGDGVIDLVVANQFVPVNGGLSVLYGDGAGAFQSPVGYSVGTPFYFVVPEDLNGDGVTDIVLAAGAANSLNVFLAIPGDPDLAIVVSHTGSFSPGQNGATYQISVSNTGALPTSGEVTVTDSLPAGLTATAIGDDGWTCNLGSPTCTRSDVLAPGASYPAITLTVNVSANAPTGVTNSVAVSGGGEVNTANDTSSDFTTIFGPSQNSQWQYLRGPEPFNQTEDFLLLTDGTVMFQQYCSSNWYRLTPDAFGNYVNGTWSQLASMPAGYGPVDYSSAVLADGRVVVIGGEFNLTDNCQTEKPISLGAIYDPRTNAWTALAAPLGWSQVGEAPNVVLPDGSLLLGNQLTTQMAKLNPATLTWTNLMSTNKADPNLEEGWVLLPDGTVLTVDYSNGTQSETYNPLTDSWTSAGSTVMPLASGSELGGMVLRPDGTVFAPGGTGHTAVYNYRARTWSAGPDFPAVGGEPLDAEEAGSVLLPNGNVLVPFFNEATQTIFTFEFDGTHLNPAPNGGGGDTLLLPTGQVLVGFSIYTPTGNANPAWAPTISSAPGVVQNGQTYTITGTQFNGFSQGRGSGDERQQATNYPLVRITNSSTGHVFYCRTHDHSTMGVATGATPVSTHFDVPQSIESGPSTLVVVANGIASIPISVLVALPGPDLTITMTHSGNFAQGQTGVTSALTVSNAGSVLTSGTVTVVWSPPAGLTATTTAGTGWTCAQASGPCTRTDALAANASYPVITLTANVTGNAPASIMNSATVAGGGEINTSNDTATDSATVIAVGTTIGPGGVVPVYSAATTIQPGSWISIYGQNLANRTTFWNGDFPASLGGVTVTINGKPGYLWYVSPTQINLQAPDDTTTGPVSVVVTTPTARASSTVTLGPYGPSFSLYNNKYAAAIVQTPGSPGNSGSGYDYIGPPGVLQFPTRPVRAGETLVLYGVGFGPTNPTVPAGQAFSSSAPSVSLPQITIGGLTATVSFAGIVEAGLFQLNVVVPNAGSGDQLLQATVAGVTTPNNVFVTVQ